MPHQGQGLDTLRHKHNTLKGENTIISDTKDNKQKNVNLKSILKRKKVTFSTTITFIPRAEETHQNLKLPINHHFPNWEDRIDRALNLRHTSGSSNNTSKYQPRKTITLQKRLQE